MKSNFAYSGSVELKRVFVESGEFKENGEPKLRPVTLRKVTLTGNRGQDELVFTVSKSPCGWKVRDPRPEFSGDRAQWVDGQLRGGSKQVSKGRSLLPTEWLAEVGRLVGEDRAHALLVEACFGTLAKAEV